MYLGNFLAVRRRSFVFSKSSLASLSEADPLLPLPPLASDSKSLISLSLSLSLSESSSGPLAFCLACFFSSLRAAFNWRFFSSSATRFSRLARAASYSGA